MHYEKLSEFKTKEEERKFFDTRAKVFFEKETQAYLKKKPFIEDQPPVEPATPVTEANNLVTVVKGISADVNNKNDKMPSEHLHVGDIYYGVFHGIIMSCLTLTSKPVINTYDQNNNPTPIVTQTISPTNYVNKPNHPQRLTTKIVNRILDPNFSIIDYLTDTRIVNKNVIKIAICVYLVKKLFPNDICHRWTV